MLFFAIIEIKENIPNTIIIGIEIEVSILDLYTSIIDEIKI